MDGDPLFWQEMTAAWPDPIHPSERALIQRLLHFAPIDQQAIT